MPDPTPPKAPPPPPPPKATQPPAAPPAVPPAPPAAPPAPALPPPADAYAPAPNTPSGTRPSTPAGWATGAYEEFRSTRAKLAAEKEERARLAAAHAQAQAEAERLRQQVTAQAQRHEQDLILYAAGGNFAAASVQRMVRQEYAAHVAEAGEGAQPFAKWFTADALKSDPLFAAHWSSVPTPPPAAGGQAPPPGGAQPPAQPPFNPSAGITAPPAGAPAGAQWTPERIAAVAQSPTEFRGAQADMRAALEARLGVCLSPSSLKRDAE